ncbi:uncharacterized protein V2V93DRAFT_366940 [Kockiozyma suomiensis]|uniref:uncharacterized protein n=1 Tax=Kockiozyma suomiensis TaxID=1337062 RepID=UPI0033435613
MSSQLRWGVNKYQDASGRMSPALMRARSKYATRNIVTGILLTGFVVSVYTYAATATGRDDFSDVPMPPIPEDTLQQLQSDRANLESKAASLAASSPVTKKK